MRPVSYTHLILNSIKTFGNIVCFRNLQKRVDAAISLFGDKNAGGIVLRRKYADYYHGYMEDVYKRQAQYAQRPEEWVPEAATFETAQSYREKKAIPLIKKLVKVPVSYTHLWCEHTGKHLDPEAERECRQALQRLWNSVRKKRTHEGRVVKLTLENSGA